MVALYCSGSRVSMFAPVEVGVVVVLALVLEVLDALTFTELLLVLVLVAGCCWQALAASASSQMAPKEIFADGFQAKMRMR